MSDSDDDVVFIPNPAGQKAQFTHARCACETHTFVAPAPGQLLHKTPRNQSKCDTCFCYVCDKPAKDCATWATHCDATDKGPNAAYWKLRRNEMKRGGAPPPPAQSTLTVPARTFSTHQPTFIPSKRYTGPISGYSFKQSYLGMGYYKSAAAAAAPARPAPPSQAAERKAMRSTPCSATTPSAVMEALR